MESNNSMSRIGGVTKWTGVLFISIFAASKLSFAEGNNYSPPECKVSTYDPSKISQYKNPIGALFTNKRYDSGVVRVYYTEEGEHAVPSRDVNRNNIPDYVEDVAAQASVAYELFNALGFKDPLESAVFRNADHINLQIYDFGGNGLAYQDAWRYQSIPWMGNDCGMQLRISNSWSDVSKASLVAHELFHLYMYGYSRFRISWFEGMARWSEAVVRGDGPYREDGFRRLPASQKEMIDQVFCKKYSSVNRFFGRLSEIMDDSGGKMMMPESGMILVGSERETVYTNGEPVVVGSRMVKSI